MWSAGAAALLPLTRRATANTAPPVPFPVTLKHPEPYEALRRFIPPGADAFSCETSAAAIEGSLETFVATGSIALAPEFEGVSPEPSRWREISPGFQEAEYTDGNPSDAASG